jgi:voltage-gated potassium channel Kch
MAHDPDRDRVKKDRSGLPSDPVVTRSAVEWPVVGALVVLALVLGYLGFARVAANASATPFDLAYLSLQLFVLQSGVVPGPIPWPLEIARFLAPGVAAWAAAKGIAVLFREEFEGFRAWRMREHVVVCGLGRKGLALVQGLRAANERVVVVELNPENLRISACRAQGALVLLGDARDQRTLRRADVARARYLVAISEDDEMNAAIVVTARALAAKPGRPELRCVAHVVEARLSDLLRLRQLEENATATPAIEFFNIFESGAAEMLRRHPVWGDRELDPSVEPHIVVVGVGHLGERLVVQAAQRWGLEETRGARRLRITLVDRHAEARCAAIAFRYPHLGAVCDIRTVPIDLESVDFYRAAFLQDEAHARPSVTATYVCVDGEPTAVAAALVLQRHLRPHGIPIAVRMKYEGGLAALLGAGNQALAGVRPFGLLERGCTPELVLQGAREVLARAIHEHYARMATARGDTPETNPSMRPWEELDEPLRRSNRDQAAHIGEKLRVVRCALAPFTDWTALDFQFTSEEVEQLAKMEHDRFVAERKADGWRPGPKNVKQKISPYLGTWAEIPPDIQKYDREFVCEMPRFLARVGLQIERQSAACSETA